jgi:predicted RNA binding protein YcfA (HicA-like mRNA interferase family)
VQTALDSGWTVTKTKRSHIKLRAPSGAIVFASGTPSDVRAVHNLKAMLRRNGLDV